MKDKIKKFLKTLVSMWDKPLPGRFLTLKEAGAFGLYALGNSWIYNTMMLVVTVTNIPYFYGVDAVHGYVVYIIGTLITSVLTPLIGNAMEKKRTRWGRYKPYVLFSLPLFALFAMMAMWIPRDAGYSDIAMVAYVYVSCVPLIAIATFANNMYQTIPNVITPNSQERADIMTPAGLLVGFAPTIMNLIVGPIRSVFINNGQGEFMAMRYIGLIAVVLGTVCIMFIIKVKERVYELETAPDGLEVRTDFSEPAGESTESAAESSGAVSTEGLLALTDTADGDSEAPEASEAPSGAAAAPALAVPSPRKEGWKEGLKDFLSLFKNKPLMILFIALLVGSLREFWVQFRPLMIQLHYSADVTVALNVSGVPNTIIGFASTVAMLLLPIVTRKLNKNAIMILFGSFGLVVCAILGFIGIDAIPIGTTSAVVLTLLFFIAMINPTYLLIPVMLGEIADWQQARTGRRYEGHLQNFIFTIPSCFTQIAMLLAWVWQSAIGFEPSQISADINEAVEAINKGANIDPTTIVSESTRALADDWFNAAFLLSAGSMLLMIIVLCFYPLTKKRHDELIKRLEAEAVNMDELEENESVLSEDGTLVSKRSLKESGGDDAADADADSADVGEGEDEPPAAKDCLERGGNPEEGGEVHPEE